MIHRSHKMASPFAGPALLRQFYKHVPQLPLPSLGWTIFRVNPSTSRAPAPLAFAGPSTIVASCNTWETCTSAPKPSPKMTPQPSS
jgi:hypothetical protein